MTSYRIFHDLCKYPKWLVDGIVRSEGRTNVVGWALPYNDDLGSAEVIVNGLRPIVTHHGDSPGLAKIFPYLRGIETCRFSAVYEGLDENVDLQISYVGRWSKEPFNKWMDIYFPSNVWLLKSIVQPEPERMIRTQGDDSFFRYVMYGYTTARKFDMVLQAYFGRKLYEFYEICDWGVGCGRVAQMVHEIAPTSKITGIDIDPENIEWNQRNLKYAKFIHIPTLPPTSLPSNSFDLVYGVSVFTHLQRDAFEQWIEELARILKPDGVLLVTINGGAGLMRQAGKNLSLINRVLETGFDDGTKDAALDSVIQDADYYRATYSLESLAIELFSSHFKVRDILRQFSGASQDLVICERR